MTNLTHEEKQYILNALDQEIRRTGLQTAAFALGIVAKLQEVAAVVEPVVGADK
ncbi:MAG: hypothetical protein V3R83_12415 [Gammaproteobacteria bacterium]